MFRSVTAWLEGWLKAPGRRPLVLRGARQVGKTWLVRDLAARSGRDLAEINFERDPTLARAFASNDPRTILGELSVVLNKEISPAHSLLFLDEIQAAAEVLPRLRWFYEELPELPVVAAGSLLEFTLADHAFSMPVGRVSFAHIEPMGFSEYLKAHGQERLLDAIAAWRPGGALSPRVHDRAMSWFHRYAMVGGMPAVVEADAAGGAPRQCRTLQGDLVAAYRADFAKYSGRMDPSIIEGTLLAVARSLGRKFVYARVGEGVKRQQAKAALERLAQARLCHLIVHSAANGLPLGAEVKDRFRKAAFVDVGLLHALVSTPAAEAFPRWDALAPALRGQLADQLVAQQLRLAVCAPEDLPEPFYWQREGGRPGEIDFLLQLQGIIIPVEVKSGAAGSMKSLHQFMHDKRLSLALRCDTNPPSAMRVAISTTRGDPVAYDLISVPLYLCWNMATIVADRALVLSA